MICCIVNRWQKIMQIQMRIAFVKIIKARITGILASHYVKIEFRLLIYIPGFFLKFFFVY